MAKVRLSEWKKKEVINCCDCKKLGYIEDLIIDECKGCIEALVVPELSLIHISEPTRP